MMRCLLPIVVLDNTADSVWSGTDLYGEGITIAIFEKNDTAPLRTALDICCKSYERKPYGYLVNYKLESDQQVEVPIKIKVIKRKYKFLDSGSLDSKLYNYEYYFLPNPFRDYWKARFLVR